MNFRKITNQNQLVEAINSTTSLKALIKLKCLDCACYDYTEAQRCTCYKCPLYKVRPGSKPELKKTYIAN